MAKGFDKHAGSGVGGMFYFVGAIGALVYFWQQANSFWDGIVGLFKAAFWPAFMVFELFKLLQV